MPGSTVLSADGLAWRFTSVLMLGCSTVLHTKLVETVDSFVEWVEHSSQGHMITLYGAGTRMVTA